MLGFLSVHLTLNYVNAIGSGLGAKRSFLNLMLNKRIICRTEVSKCKHNLKRELEKPHISKKKVPLFCQVPLQVLAVSYHLSSSDCVKLNNF